MKLNGCSAVSRAFRRNITSRFEKLDVMFVGFICFALIADGLHRVNRP